MKNAGRFLLIAAGVLLGLVAVGLLAVNLYVQSKSTQARIEDELSQRLGATLRIQRISVTPWSGLKLSGITMPQSNPEARPEFLRADTFRLRVRFLSLFSNQLVIREVALVRPTVGWAENADGQWRLPTAQAEAMPPTVAPVPAAPLTPSAAADRAQESVAPAAAAPAAAPALTTAPVESDQSPAETFTPEVRRVVLTHGDFHFLDSKQKPIATFERVDFRSSFRSGSELRGTASIAKISLRNRFFLADLHSPLRYDATTLDFDNITARAGDGEITGRFTMKPADPDSPFTVRVHFSDVQADRLVTDAHGPAGMIYGRIEGQLDASGKTADPNALAGAGEIRLRDGEVRQYSLLVALGQLLQIDELKQLHFDEARVKYRIQPGVVMVDELLLSSANIRLSATGTIGFDGKLRLNSQLAIDDKIRNQLFRAIRDNFRPTEPPGFAAVAFEVGGTIERPKSNLMKKVIGGEVRDLGGLINSLFGSRKSNHAKTSGAGGEEPPAADVPPTSPAESAPDAPSDAAESPTPASSP